MPRHTCCLDASGLLPSLRLVPASNTLIDDTATTSHGLDTMGGHMTQQIMINIQCEAKCCSVMEYDAATWSQPVIA